MLEDIPISGILGGWSDETYCAGPTMPCLRFGGQKYGVLPQRRVPSPGHAGLRALPDNLGKGASDLVFDGSDADTRVSSVSSCTHEVVVEASLVDDEEGEGLGASHRARFAGYDQLGRSSRQGTASVPARHVGSCWRRLIRALLPGGGLDRGEW